MRLLEQSQKNIKDPKFGGEEASLIDCDIYKIHYVPMAQAAE